MTNRPIRRVHTGNRVADDAQRSAQESARRLNDSVLGAGVLLHAEAGKPDRTGLKFTAGVARTMPHRLGRKAVGFLEVYGVDAPSAARVGLFPTAGAAGLSSDDYLTLTPTSTGTCFVFVF